MKFIDVFDINIIIKSFEKIFKTTFAIKINLNLRKRICYSNVDKIRLHTNFYILIDV